MKHVTLAVLLVLLCAIPAFGQSTTVSGQVTDGGGQSWNNGTITFTFLPNPAYPSGPYSWTGGAFNPYQTYNSALNGTGGYSALSVPSSSAITPTGTQWKVTVCAQATAPCYSTTAILSGASQTVNVTPAALQIGATPNNVVYGTSEVASPNLGNQIYTIGTGLQTYNGSTWASSGGGGSWSTITSGTNTNTGLFQSYQAGNFLTGALRETTFHIIGTDSTCSWELTAFHTDALAGCATTPASGVTNGWTTGISGYVQVNDPTQGGLFGKVEGVGMYTSAVCNANNTKCEGEAPQVASTSGKSGVVLIGSEIGVMPSNTTDSGEGILLSFEGGNAQPTADNMPGVLVQTPSGTGTWTTGFECGNGSISTTQYQSCVTTGKVHAAGNSPSLTIAFTSNDGTTDHAVALGLGPGANIQYSAGVPVSASSFTTYLTATAALSANQLVKVDTANADSVVVCTTTDTVCHGFVNQTTVTDCGAASTICPITAASGQRVKAILGTGTCAIGNFVIADTTTNGRVKCTASQPATGATMGLALAANSTVGTTFDVLTKFQ